MFHLCKLPAIVGMTALAVCLAPDGGAAGGGVDLDAFKKLLAERDGQLNAALDEGRKEIKRVGELTNETRAQLETVSKDHLNLTDAIKALERKMQTPGGGAAASRVKSVGERFAESEEFKASLKDGRGDQTGKIPFSLADGWGTPRFQAAILNQPGQNQPLVADMRVPGIITPPERRLTIRDLLPVGQTSSNLIQFAREDVFTNAAAVVADASPAATEGVLKPESNITFTLANAPVQTVAHWVPASRQVLDDVPMLQSYIDGRMRYGLKLVEESQLLNGDGTGANLNGLMTQASAYNRNATGDTALDTLRKAILQAALAEYPVDGIVLHPIEWAAIELLKDTQGRYIIGDPRGMLSPMVWGRPVVETNSQTQGQFLVGAFQFGAQIWDRMEVTVEIARQHADFFIRNMVVVLCEERIALTVYRPAAFIKGTF